MKEIIYLNKELKEYFEGTKATTACCRYIPKKNLTPERFSNIWFANPTEWKDPFEQLFINTSYKLKGKSDVEFGLNGRIFCLCLAADRQCEAAWKAYKSDAQFTLSKVSLIEILKSNLPKYDIYIGRVVYKDGSELCTASYAKLCGKKFIQSKDESWIRLLLLKRMNYQYEKEIRIILVDKKSKKEREGISIPIKKPYSNLYTSVFLRPNISKKEELKIREHLTKKLGLPSDTIKKDPLYDNLKSRKAKNMNLDYKPKKNTNTHQTKTN